MTRFALIANPKAGGKVHEALATARAELERLGGECRALSPSSPQAAREQAQQSSTAGEVVVAVGGDGLVRLAAIGVRAGGGALAIVPGGRGNDLARVLGIPSDSDAAARTAFEGHERRIDVASANGEPFVGIASLGFDSDANRIANDARLVRGKLVYLYAALRALAAWKPATFELTVDGAQRSIRGYSVAVGNSKAYGGGMYLLPHAELDDGELDVFTSGEASKLSFLTGLPKVFKGTHLDNPAVTIDRGRRVTVSADRPFDVYADGDPIATLPVEIEVERQALRVIVPADAG